MTMNKNILAVDDEPKILEAVKAFLESKGYTVCTAQNGMQALEVFEKQNISLILLDLMLPDISGEEVCTRIRKKSRVPIIMLTAKSEEANQLKGLDIGADDYITKPFSLKVIAARIETVLRRTTDDLVPLTIKNSWRDGDLTVDFEKGIVSKHGKEVNLTATELKILSALIKYPGKIFSREELLTLVLGDNTDSLDRVIDNHIKNLRQKIEDDTKTPVYVLTIRGLGYKFGGE
ncbi:response regulator transcription factor [Faecalicatena contorta]|uniref:Stage 0 sporulation protein A homolog n=1 Tax=Faecalicatena contorta TaxID=39482 RepID=A0A315ZTM0_9FIRM|nr:response regulator transcription factor [Faecalicatena contorta]PWJ48906.1 DNA-binding response OmpR family regulator [Faecalicatena contorta]SUQ14996.1 DNA-binding response regulator, OmpR family, contains REC and winged-helix (wHTH) domain [Faecalicatena contorta]